MAFSQTTECFAIILIFFLITSGCVFPQQTNSTFDNSTNFITTSIPTIVVSEQKIVKNDTYWIKIDDLDNGYPKVYEFGFNITAQTNLPIDENILIMIYNATSWTEGYSGYSTTENAKVTNGDNSTNKIAFHVNPRTLPSADYIVLMSAGEKGPSNFTKFTIWPTP